MRLTELLARIQQLSSVECGQHIRIMQVSLGMEGLKNGDLNFLKQDSSNPISAVLLKRSRGVLLNNKELRTYYNLDMLIRLNRLYDYAIECGCSEQLQTALGSYDININCDGQQLWDLVSIFSRALLEICANKAEFHDFILSLLSKNKQEIYQLESGFFCEEPHLILGKARPDNSRLIAKTAAYEHLFAKIGGFKIRLVEGIPDEKDPTTVYVLSLKEEKKYRCILGDVECDITCAECKNVEMDQVGLYGLLLPMFLTKTAGSIKHRDFVVCSERGDGNCALRSIARVTVAHLFVLEAKKNNNTFIELFGRYALEVLQLDEGYFTELSEMIGFDVRLKQECYLGFTAFLAKIKSGEIGIVDALKFLSYDTVAPTLLDQQNLFIIVIIAYIMVTGHLVYKFNTFETNPCLQKQP